MKKEVRIIGFDDSPFKKFSKQNNLVIGVIMRGGLFFEGLLTLKVRVDGFNSTKKLSEAINKSKFKGQLKAVLLDGICLAGFNVVNVKRLYESTGIPVLTIMRDYPNMKDMTKAIKHTTNADKRLKIISVAGKVHKVKIRNKNISGYVFYQNYGCSVNYAEEIIKLTTTRSLAPEPLRIAHLIASGIAEGESRGRA